jgi:hypothetical protein
LLYYKPRQLPVNLTTSLSNCPIRTMQLTSATLLVAGLAVQQASATFPWSIDAGKFSTCGNTDTTCSTEQHKGYDWTGLNIGKPVTSYGANTFSGGWTCNSIKSKRDELTKRHFNSKCVSGKLPSRGSSASPSKNGAGSLSIGCSGEKNKFSISEMHISSTYNTNVDCHYNMPDGSVCKHSVPCSAGGSIVKNTQCGGAISVSFSHGKPSSSGPSSNKGDCDLNIHSVGFACGSGSTSSIVSLPSSGLTSSSSAVYSSTGLVSSNTASPETTSSETTPETTSSELSPETTSAELPYTTPSSVNTVSSTVIVSSSHVVIPGTSAPFPTGAQNQTTTQPTADSSAVYVPTSSEVSPAESSASSVIVPSIGTGVSPSGSILSPSSGTGIYANSTIVSSATTSSASSSLPSANCPAVVPSCLNTYLQSTGCANNADADCYCKDEDFINSVYQCIDAYGGSDENVSQAMSYMVGICAKAIPSNPAIITAVPSTIDIQPTSSTVNAVTGSSLSTAVPESSDITTGSMTSSVPTGSATDSIVYVTDVVKSTLTTCPIGHTITSAGSTTVLTAPSVIATEITTKSTITASIISSITGALPSGETAFETSPVETSAQGSPSAAIPTETSSASVHVQVPVTVTLFSTQIDTITSCAPEVTNCPATLKTSLFPTGSSTTNIYIPVTTAQETTPIETTPAETSPAASSGVSSGVVSTAVQVPSGSSPVSSAQETSPVQNTSAQESSPAETTPAVSTGVSSGVVSSAAGTPSASSPASSAAYETSPAETTPTISSAPSVPKTVTLFSTKIDTITSCAEDVTNCPATLKTSLIATGVTTAPASYETDAVPASPTAVVPEVQSTVIITDVVKTTVTTCPIGQVITSAGSTTTLTTPSVITSQITIKSTISTTVPAQTQTMVSPGPSSADAVMPSSVTSAPSAPKTLTIYSSVVATITSCAADVTDCPASSTVQSTSFYAVGTTTEAPVVPVITTSEVAPATTTPAVVASSSQPMTTITYSSELVVPATYTAGESQGATIPNSKTTSTIHRTLTVPQVQFITATVSGKPTVGLTYPSAVPATTTAEAVPTSPIADAATPAVSAPAVSAASSGFAPGSSTLASTYNMPAKPTGSPISYTGAGAKVSGSFAAFAFAAVAAIFVL